MTTTKDVIVERTGNREYTLQYFGIYPNMHYDFSKLISAIMGVLGAKVTRIE
ncbi:MAG: hypothetical protein ACOC44_15905 [Promethearchaeia archaeon]